MPAAVAPLRVTVLVPVAAPYREPLFAGLHARGDIELSVVYSAAGQPSWDVPENFFRAVDAHPAIQLRSHQLPRPGRTPIMFPSGVERALRASRPEVIVASEYGPTAIRARTWAGYRRIPYLILTECTPEIDALLPPAQLRWHRHFARNADGAIVVSSAARRRLLSFGVAPERVTVALQSADLSAIHAAAADRGHDPLRVLTAARLVPDKNIALLMRALRQAADDIAPRRVVLDVAGEGSLHDRLVAVASELGLGVTFHGHRDSAGLAALYARADVFALLSAYEPFGVVIREAAAAGLPIVTTGVVGAVGDIAIDTENALVLTAGDVSAAAVALGRLLCDDELRERMAARSRAIDAATAGSEVVAFADAAKAAAAAYVT